MEQPQLPSDDDIVFAYANHSSLDQNDKCFVYPSHEAPVALIKHDHKAFGIVGEARNQQYAFQALQQIPEQERRGIRIPKIYRVIDRHDSVYIVMEYVPGKTLREISNRDDYTDSCLYSQIEKALRLFLSFKVPSTVPPGPAGGGLIRHPIFKYTTASVIYKSVDKLQEHLSKVCISIAVCLNI